MKIRRHLPILADDDNVELSPEYLMEKGLDPNTMSWRRVTILMIWRRMGLKSGADWSAPLARAKKKGFATIEELLADQGVSQVNWTSVQQLEIARGLLRNNARVANLRELIMLRSATKPIANANFAGLGSCESSMSRCRIGEQWS